MARPAILCVDDERTVLVALKEQLRRAFGSTHLVEVAEDGNSALEILEELREEGVDVPVVISDHIMPGIKGDALLATIRERDPEIVKIMLTGQAGADAVGNAINRAGLYRYIAKPWDEADLVMTVRSALEAHAGARALAEQQATLSRLNALALDLTSNLAGQDRHERLVRQVAEALGVERSALFEWDGTRLRRLAAIGGRPDDTPRHIRPREGSPLASLLHEGGISRCDGQHACLAADFGWSDLEQGVAGLALEALGEVVGLLAIGDADGARLGSDERLGAFGALAAASLRTARLIDALEASSVQQRRVAGALQQAADERSAGPMQGSSAEIRGVLAGLMRATERGGVVMLLGPVGSGREAAARYLHRVSPRSSGPFIMVTGAAILAPQELELATGGGPGPFQLAEGGTLYIAGVDRVPLAAQRSLARTLGDLGDPARLQVVMSPSVGDEGRTRDLLVPELLSRVVSRVALPALRNRSQDIPTLVDFYLRAHATRLGKQVERLEAGDLERLVAYPWPGNVRELDRVVERAVLTATGPVVRVGAMAFDAAERLGSYRLTEQIGAGAMGEVWKAEHELLARPAAVKLIKTSRTLSAAARDQAMGRFRREAAATARLRSPHTVELYDFGISETGDLYYVMELLEGVDLQTLVTRFGALPAERVVHLLDQACHSLMEAHEAGLVHRDIKPANLFVGRLGPDPDFLKVLDFGMVSIDLGEDATALTAPGSLAGTPLTMAPEAIEGAVGPRSDLYSLGCTAYFLLTGRPVFGSRVPALLLDHASTPPTPPSQVAPHPVPEGLEAAILACLAKSPDDRPASARVLRRLLRDVELTQPWTDERAAAWWEDRQRGSEDGKGDAHQVTW